jgi:N-acetylglucosamine repressor
MQLQAQKATQRQTKTYNSQLVLKTIYDRGQISRAEVARLTDLTRTSVSDIVTELQDKGLVEEVGVGASVGGRAPILLSVVNNALHVIGVDLGADAFRGALVDLRHEVQRTVALPVSGPAGAAALDRLYALLDALLAGAERPVLGIGIGTPGLVDTASGVVLRAVNLEWRDLPLRALLQERYRLPVYVANDSQLAAMAHYMAGGAQTGGSLVVIKSGHGIGAGVVLNGQIFPGDGFGAGEIGHVTLVADGDLCRCGNRGCLETLVSDPAILARAAGLAAQHPDSLLRGQAGASNALSMDRIAAAVRAGDPAALDLAREAGQWLGVAAAHLVGALNVRRIILVGSLAEFGAPLQAAMQDAMRRRVLPALADQTRIELAGAAPNIVIEGAAALLLARELGLDLAR